MNSNLIPFYLALCFHEILWFFGVEVSDPLSDVVKMSVRSL